MRFYLGGPMRGYENYNFQAFEDATTRMRVAGYDVVSPHEIDIAEGHVDVSREWIMGGYPRWRYLAVELTDDFSVERALRRDIAEILTVDAVCFLPGWKGSSGCAIEDTVRSAIGIPRYLITPDSAVPRMDYSDMGDVERCV